MTDPLVHSGTQKIVVTPAKQQIVVDQKTQRIEVKHSPQRIGIINAGPPGPPGLRGLQGDPGPPGPTSSGETILFEQSSPSDLWDIVHNMNNYPVVTVVDSTGEVVDGLVTYVDSNRIVVSFSAAFSGKAFLN